MKHSTAEIYEIDAYRQSQNREVSSFQAVQGYGYSLIWVPVWVMFPQVVVTVK